MTPAYRKYVTKHVKAALGYLNLQGYTIDVCFQEQAYPSEETERFADITVDPNYFEARIRVYPPCFELWQRKKYTELAETLVHEVCHIYTWDLWQMAKQAATAQTEPYICGTMEQLTQRIALLVMRDIPKKVFRP